MPAEPFRKNVPTHGAAPRRAPKLTFGQKALLLAGLITLNLPGTICAAGMAPPNRASPPGTRQAVVMSEKNTLPNACMAPVDDFPLPTMIRSLNKGNK